MQIKKAKNDQKGEGHPRRAYRQDDEHDVMCAYRAIERWLMVRPAGEGPMLFQHVGQEQGPGIVEGNPKPHREGRIEGRR